MTNDVVPYNYVFIQYSYFVVYKTTKMATITSYTIANIKDNKILITCQIYLKYNYLNYSNNKCDMGVWCVPVNSSSQESECEETPRKARPGSPQIRSPPLEISPEKPVPTSLTAPVDDDAVDSSEGQ